MRKHSRVVFAGCSLLGLLFGLRSAGAQAGSLDRTFGQGGTLVTTLAVANVTPFCPAAVLQPNGDILVALTTVTAGSGTAFEVVRFLPSGRLDTTFGSGGHTVTAISQFANTSALRLQTDGKIVVVGQTINPQGVDQFAVVRYTSTGQLDSTFGSGGVVTTQFTTQPQSATAVIVQSDAKILVGGFSRNINTKGLGLMSSLVRYNPNGTLDTSFGSGGTVVTASQQTAQSGDSEIALDAAGDIFVRNISKIAEYSSRGVLNPVVTVSTLIADSANGFYGDGRYLHNNRFSVARNDVDIQVVRFQAYGTVDNSFNNPPFDFKAEGPGDEAGFVTLQPNGKVIVVGSQGNWGVARLNSDGSPDATFDGGIVITNIPAEPNLSLTQADGRIVVIGRSFNADFTEDLALARYLSQ